MDIKQNAVTGEINVADNKTPDLGNYTLDAIKHFAALRQGKRKAFLSGLDLAASILTDTALAIASRNDNAGASFCIQLAETITKQSALMRRMKTGARGDGDPADLPQFEIHRVTYGAEQAPSSSVQKPGGVLSAQGVLSNG